MVNEQQINWLEGCVNKITRESVKLSWEGAVRTESPGSLTSAREAAVRTEAGHGGDELIGTRCAGAENTLREMSEKKKYIADICFILRLGQWMFSIYSTTTFENNSKTL